MQSTTNSKHVVGEDCYGDNTMWTGLRIHGDTVIEIDPPFIVEDRLSFNPNNVAAVQISTRWKVVDGNHWILDFDQKRTTAERAVPSSSTTGFLSSALWAVLLAQAGIP